VVPELLARDEMSDERASHQFADTRNMMGVDVTTPPMKERLARILDPIAWSDRYKPDDKAHAQQYALATIDAILAEAEAAGYRLEKIDG